MLHMIRAKASFLARPAAQTKVGQILSPVAHCFCVFLFLFENHLVCHDDRTVDSTRRKIALLSKKNVGAWHIGNIVELWPNFFALL